MGKFYDLLDKIPMMADAPEHNPTSQEVRDHVDRLTGWPLQCICDENVSLIFIDISV